MKKIAFLSFGHWTRSPQSQTQSAADALLQSIDLAVGSLSAHLPEDPLNGQIIESLNYAHENGIDKKEIREWKWPL